MSVVCRQPKNGCAAPCKIARSGGLQLAAKKVLGRKVPARPGTKYPGVMIKELRLNTD